MVNVQAVMAMDGVFRLGLMVVIMIHTSVQYAMEVVDAKCVMAIEDVMSDKFSESDRL